eukprot:m.2712 g.2712  ORF g.2712 m.2712 type:complete len:130 (+) comp3236_c0_seq1:38-427(+)
MVRLTDRRKGSGCDPSQNTATDAHGAVGILSDCDWTNYYQANTSDTASNIDHAHYDVGGLMTRCMCLVSGTPRGASLCRSVVVRFAAIPPPLTLPPPPSPPPHIPLLCSPFHLLQLTDPLVITLTQSGA